MEVAYIICVDDACPEGSGRLIEAACQDPRVSVIFHTENQGVGGAMITGFRAALARGADIVVKVDGDGQMDPGFIPVLIAPILASEADYTKGNRFFSLDAVRGMPPVRLFGNAILSFLTKLSTGYWSIFDPTNGFVAIHGAVLRLLPLENVARRYFFESDMLFRLSTFRAVVADVPMAAYYGSEASNLRIGRIVGPFLLGHSRNFCKRIFYNYFLRDFHIASVELVLGLAMILFGALIGATAWYEHARLGNVTPAGTVMLAALPLFVGIQLLLSFLNFDIRAEPSRPIHLSVHRSICG
jgi:glycosyltransferase involved in cell wall biosynthesis